MKYKIIKFLIYKLLSYNKIIADLKEVIAKKTKE